MSCDMMVRVWNAQTEPRRKLALVELADNAGAGESFRARLAWLARFACCSEDDAREDLSALEKLGYICNVRENGGYIEGQFTQRCA